jgi:hypothetical protein
MRRKRHQQHFAEGKPLPPTLEEWCEARNISVVTFRRWELKGKRTGRLLAPRRLQPGGRYGQSWITPEATAEWERENSGLASTVVAAE